MTSSIDSLFRSAMAYAGAWGPDDVRHALELLASPGFRIDWEPGDEEWGRIVDASGNVHALICARVPAGIGLEDVDSKRLDKSVSWMTVTSMTDQQFEADPLLLEQVFGRRLSQNLDYSRLSITDLWWATLS